MQLRALGLERILHAPDELATQTAAVLARQLSVPTKALDDLAEVDLGLWTGLTEAQLKTRFASAHRELREAPLNVNPPGGESLSARRRPADRRASASSSRRTAKTAIGVVLRPDQLGRWPGRTLGGGELSELWESTARRGPSRL